MADQIKIKDLDPTASPTRELIVPSMDAAGTATPGLTVAQILSLIQTGDLPTLAAALITYDNAGSGLSAEDLQDAVDEVVVALEALTTTVGDISPGISGITFVITEYTTPGSDTWTKHADTLGVISKVQGAGGGGGGNNTDGAAGGGGAGGYSEKFTAAAGLAASETVTVGAKGAGGASTPANGGNGGTSSFGSLHSATGGTGGGSASGVANGAGGAGGSGSGGDVNQDGGNGSDGVRGTTAGSSGSGGNSPSGGAGPGVKGSTSNSANAKANTGSGGGGGYASAGGDGADGKVVIVEIRKVD